MALTTNLVSMWPLDEASGNAIDAHGEHDLTETSGTIAAASGPAGLAGARDFEAGDSEWFQVADHADLSAGDTDFTVAAWVQMESAGTRTFLSKFEATGNQREWRLGYNNTSGRFVFLVSPTGSSTTVSVSADNFGPASLATWYHVVAWHDSVNNQLGIAVNAGTPDTLSHTTGVFDGTAPFVIGAYNVAGTPTEFWDGLIAQAAMWRRVLTSDERTALYAAGAGLPYSSWASGKLLLRLQEEGLFAGGVF